MTDTTQSFDATPPRCPVCIEHPGWAYPEETGKRSDPADTCRACFGSGVDQNPPRSYCVGLPVCVNVYPDGKVEISVDLSEIGDIDEDESAAERYLGPQVALDALTVSEAASSIGNWYTLPVIVTGQPTA